MTSEGSGLTIARIGGVTVRIGWSWFLLAVVLVLTQAQAYSGMSGLGVVVGIGYAVALLVAVLVHEGAHAGVARAFGIKVHRVVADLFGGHTAYDAAGLTPGRSAVIAFGGPLANALLGVTALGVGSLLTDPLTAVIVHDVGRLNLALAIFNILPGLPLDGGQLVDALVWGVTGRRSRGLVVAGWAGRLVTVLALVLVLGIPLLSGGSPSIFAVSWAAVIGLFMWQGSTHAIARGQFLGFVEHIRLAEVADPVAVLPASATLADARNSGRVVLAPDEHGRPLLLLASPEGTSWSDLPGDTPLSALLVRLPDSALADGRPQDSVEAALGALAKAPTAPVVLVEGGRAWGVTSWPRVESVARARH